LAWISIQNEVSIIPFEFYLGATFWTLGFDTIYGYQDINDDEIIGVKSTSIKFKNNPKKFISFCYIVFLVSLFLVGYKMNFNYLYYIALIAPLTHLLIFQSYKLNTESGNDCLRKFKSNNFLGLLILIILLIGKLT
jgi:4-hydroxybenzoate polyprenyltransferase and related prenyltransferases